MDFLFKHKRMVVLAVAFIYIFYGIAGAIFKFNVRNSLFDNLTLVLMMLVLYLYFGGRNRNSSASETEKQKDETKEISDNVSSENVDISNKEVQNEINKNSETGSEQDKE